MFRAVAERGFTAHRAYVSFPPSFFGSVSDPFHLLLATGNAGKVAELKALLADLPIRLRTLDDVSGAPDVVEDRETLEGNARKKADVLSTFAGLPALADDTGLEVDGLGGKPGVRTARYAGEEASSADNCRKLLSVLEGRSDRDAQFRTVVALAGLDGETRCFEGLCRGRIAREERGTGGFGYDAIFVPDEQRQARTFAEMEAEEKNAVSHRRRALDAFRAFLRQHLAERAQR